MDSRLDKGDFLSLFGFEKVWDQLELNGFSTHAVVATDRDGGTIRSMLFRAKKIADGQFRVRLKYMCHTSPNQNDVVNVLELKAKPEKNKVTIISAKVRGEDIDLEAPGSVYNVSRAFKDYSRAIIGNNEWVNPVKVLDDNGLLSSVIGREAWPGLYNSGDFKSTNAPVSESNGNESVYPALFLPAILGVGPETYSGKKDNTRTFAVAGDDQGGQPKTSLLKYSYKEGESSRDLSVKAVVASHSSTGSEEDVLYEVKTKPAEAGTKNATAIVKLRFMGHDIDLTNPEATAATLKAIRNINRLIRAGDQGVIEDLKREPQNRRLALPTELALHLGLYSHFNKSIVPPKQGIMSFHAIGGNNAQAYVSQGDKSIGANQYVVGYEYNDEQGLSQKEGVMVDAGILFHDVFDSAFFNADKYLHHKTNKSHIPEMPVQAIMFTHRHKDHLGQLAHLVKAGYQLPVIVLSEMGQRQLDRDMRELKIEKSVRDEIFNQCYAVDLVNDIDTANPNERKVTEIAGTKIEQWTEVLDGNELASKHYYPVLQIGAFTIRCGPMPHSDPGLMFDFITPAGSHRHTGDYKLDDTIKMGLPPLEIWAKGFQPDTISADSTGATKADRNPTEQEVQDSIVQLLHENPDKRFIFPKLGSNLARLTTTVAALGSAETMRKTLIVDGKAVNDLASDANKVFQLKAWAKRVYDVDVILATEKKTAAEYVDDPSRDGEYALLVTGTQDEPYSSMNRAARDDLPLERYSITDNDVICFLQGVIPTGKNAFRRLDLKKYIEKFHQAEVLLPEVVEKESSLLLHSSGHNDPAGMATMIEWSGRPTVFPVHGGPEQLGAHQKIAEKCGAETYMLSPSQSVRIRRGKKVDPYRIVPTEMVGITLHIPDPSKFYMKGRYATSVLKIKPVLNTRIERLVDDMEDSLRKYAGIESPFEMARTLRADLSRIFNFKAKNNFLSQDMPFGIDKYRGQGKDKVLDEKNIHAVGAFDTETGGLDPTRYTIREVAVVIKDRGRKTLSEDQLFQKIPDYRMPSVQAMLVTDTDPAMLDEGLDGPEFAESVLASLKSIKTWSHSVAQEKASEEDPGAKVGKNDVKAICVAHNARYDNRFLFRDLVRNLVMDTKPNQTRGIISLDTRNISRALGAYLSDGQYTVPINPETGFADHRLGPLCEANGIQVDESQTHGGLYDTGLCLELFWHQYDVSSDVVGQMVINSDGATNHLLNDMRGVDTGFNGPHPVFSYVSPDARRPKAQMGSMIGTLQDDRYAVIFNLKYDPNDYLHLPADDMANMLADRDCDVFELLDLKQQPIIMPARLGLRVKANGQVPKETLDIRAGTINRHLNYVDPKANWQTLSQKLNQAWEDRLSDIFKARIVDPQVDLHEGASHMLKEAATVDDSALDLLQTHNRIGFSPTYRFLHQNLRDYRAALQSEDTVTASSLYKSIREHRKKYTQVMDAINNIHYDVAPKDLTSEDRERVEAMREVMRFKAYHTVLDGIEEIETDPGAYERYIGESRQKRALFDKIKVWAHERGAYADLSNKAKRFVNPAIDLTRKGGGPDRPPPGNDDGPSGSLAPMPKAA